MIIASGQRECEVAKIYIATAQQGNHNNRDVFECAVTRAERDAAEARALAAEAAALARSLASRRSS